MNQTECDEPFNTRVDDAPRHRLPNHSSWYPHSLSLACISRTNCACSWWLACAAGNGGGGLADCRQAELPPTHNHGHLVRHCVANGQAAAAWLGQQRQVALCSA